jgi:hypothetical protein
MNLDLTDEEAAALIRELASIIDGNRYLFSKRIRILKAIPAKLSPEPPRIGITRGEAQKSELTDDRLVFSAISLPFL